MKNETKALVFGVAAIVLALLLIWSITHDATEAACEVCDECTVLSAETCESYVTCPTVVEASAESCAEYAPTVNETLCADYVVELTDDEEEVRDVKDSILALAAAKVIDEDFTQDEVKPLLEDLKSCEIVDEEDILSFELEGSDITWDVDDETGSYEIEYEYTFYCDDERDVERKEDILITGEFDEDSLEDMEDEEELESYELIEA